MQYAPLTLRGLAKTLCSHGLNRRQRNDSKNSDIHHRPDSGIFGRPGGRHNDPGQRGREEGMMYESPIKMIVDEVERQMAIIPADKEGV